MHRQLKIMFFNKLLIIGLVLNAFLISKYLSRQNQSVVNAKLIDDKLDIRVKDNGKGIPDEIKDKIFQPFFTTKPTGEGTGLGLSLSYDIITKGHGGELKVESQEGAGTEFIIYLPFDQT